MNSEFLLELSKIQVIQSITFIILWLVATVNIYFWLPHLAKRKRETFITSPYFKWYWVLGYMLMMMPFSYGWITLFYVYGAHRQILEVASEITVPDNLLTQVILLEIILVVGLLISGSRQFFWWQILKDWQKETAQIA